MPFFIYFKVYASNTDANTPLAFEFLIRVGFISMYLIFESFFSLSRIFFSLCD